MEEIRARQEREACQEARVRELQVEEGGQELDDGSVTGEQACRLVVAYGLRDGALAGPVPREPVAYVPYFDDVGGRESWGVPKRKRLLAALMWREGATMKAICAELDITWNQLDGLITRNRDMFPRRREYKGRNTGRPEDE